jgi:hypothetical protein
MRHQYASPQDTGPDTVGAGVDEAWGGDAFVARGGGRGARTGQGRGRRKRPLPSPRLSRPYGYALPSPQNIYPCGPPPLRLQSLFSNLSVYLGMSHDSRDRALTASETSHRCIVGNE